MLQLGHVQVDGGGMRFVAHRSLTSDLVAEIKRLEQEVIAADGISMKLELDYKLAQMQNETVTNEFLYYEDEKLVAYLGILAFGDSAEISGMVHPAYRRRGIFSTLLNEAGKTLKERNVKDVLLLVDEKSKSGKVFIEKVGGTYKNSEFEMTYRSIPLIHIQEVELTRAKAEDIDSVMEIDQACLGQKYDSVIENTYIERVDNLVVGKGRLQLIEGEGGIFGLGILPEHQGKGYGKALLENSIKTLEDMGAKRVFLQVVTENENALGLYLKTGFEVDYQMNYYTWVGDVLDEG